MSPLLTPLPVDSLVVLVALAVVGVVVTVVVMTVVVDMMKMWSWYVSGVFALSLVSTDPSTWAYILSKNRICPSLPPPWSNHRTDPCPFECHSWREVTQDTRTQLTARCCQTPLNVVLHRPVHSSII